jgi:hypothetical protein
MIYLGKYFMSTGEEYVLTFLFAVTKYHEFGGFKTTEIYSLLRL